MIKLMMSKSSVSFLCIQSVIYRIISRACRIAWHPEACDFVIEGVPSKPYGFLPSHFNTVEANMRLRREQVQKILSEQSDCEYILNIAAFPG
jgi:hypothetical protein